MVWMDPDFRYPTKPTAEQRAAAAEKAIPIPDTPGWRLTRHAGLVASLVCGLVLVGAVVLLLVAVS